MTTDTDLAAAIGVLGAHDVCSYPTTGMQCWSTAAAVASGKPLWHSEVGAMPGADGSAMVRSVIRGYIDARMTGHIQWPLITTQPPGLFYQDRGLIRAAQPRSRLLHSQGDARRHRRGHPVHQARLDAHR